MTNNPYPIALKTVFTLSILLYVISLTQEGFCTVTRCGGNWNGFAMVALGAIGGILSAAGLVWYANPLLWAAWWFLKKQPKKAIYFSGAATAISLSFLLFTEIADQQPGRESYITAYKAGYWLWVATMIATLLGSIVLFFIKKQFGEEEERYYPY
ncbi:hypothetical protein [Mucilaginibacter auburnensis]|uniref:Uncharacterized protein n=1 Tax=Mucilaginibacter auburnensis TaxID=1457233 RepID=A0A2H9VVJ5_9SPHI|nr:hypothetical protein [Mucilaginibacter auburnensis]PJJ84809.1 hypothetical protein CLV57_1831 [Mucilaginibacter auburnensis]